MTKKELRKIEADEREAKTGMRQSTGQMIAKIVIGGLFIAAAFGRPENGWSFHYFLTGIVMGVGLIAWGVIPYLHMRQNKKQQAMDQLERILTTPLETFEDKEKQIDNERLKILEEKYKNK